jgi:hypothetical protein
LKKRTKKLLNVKGSRELAVLNCLLAAISKSFLLLFFKKEVLLFLSSLWLPGYVTTDVHQICAELPAQRSSPMDAA